VDLLSHGDLERNTNHIEQMLEAIAGVYEPPRTVEVDVFCPDLADTVETSGAMRLVAPLCAVYTRDRGFVFTFYVRSDTADAYRPLLPSSITLKPYSRTALDQWGWDPDGINYNRC
jgi:hypothetical protein